MKKLEINQGRDNMLGIVKPVNCLYKHKPFNYLYKHKALNYLYKLFTVFVLSGLIVACVSPPPPETDLGGTEFGNSISAFSISRINFTPGAATGSLMVNLMTPVKPTSPITGIEIVVESYNVTGNGLLITRELQQTRTILYMANLPANSARTSAVVTNVGQSPMMEELKPIDPKYLQSGTQGTFEIDNLSSELQHEVQARVILSKDELTRHRPIRHPQTDSPRSIIIAVDSDGDGFAAGEDNCPSMPNPEQLDTDNDGMGNACDLDNDNDDINDYTDISNKTALDNCRFTYNPDQKNDYNQTNGGRDDLGDACEPHPDVRPGVKDIFIIMDRRTGDVILDWVNPSAEQEILSVIIEYSGYNEIFGGGPLSGAGGREVITNRRYLQAGESNKYTLSGLHKARYYSFKFIVGYTDGDFGMATATSRSRISLPPFLTATDLQLKLISNNIESATVSWRNPRYLVAGAPIISGEISYVGYDSLAQITPVNGSAGTLNLTQGQLELGTAPSHTFNNLDAALYYSFTLALTYNVTLADRALSVSSTSRLLITQPSQTCPSPGQFNLIDDIDGDGCLNSDDIDDDGDGVLDTVDNCPVNANTNQLNTDGDMQGDACDTDDDNDDVVDAYDLYPRDNRRAGDYDEDDVDSFVDVDYDGDGLIEVSTAAELDMLRNNLQGTGLSSDAGRQGNSNGCGGTDGVTACSGYELMADIDLAAAGYTNWEPIGSCGDAETCLTNTHLYFNSIFEGNDNVIHNLNIASSSSEFGVGLFGVAGAGAEFNNINLANINIDVPASTLVGGLVGLLINGGTISSSSVEVNQIATNGSVGGLAGVLYNGSSIASSHAKVDEISFDFVGGGLVGFLNVESSVSSSTAIVNKLISSDYSVGGLVGGAQSSAISSSFAEVNQIIGDSSVGGLIGDVFNSTISYSSAEVNHIAGRSQVGGLIGNIDRSSIDKSTTVVNNITGNFEVGGFIGSGYATTISSSSVIVNLVGDDNTFLGYQTGGLAGWGYDMRIIYSSAIVNQLSGTNQVGPLVGTGAGENLNIDNSYVVVNSIDGYGDSLVGYYNPDVYAIEKDGYVEYNFTTSSNSVDTSTIARASYWNEDAVFSSGPIGEDKSRSELTGTTSFTGIYADWDESYCNPTTGTTSTTQRSGFIPVWNLGNANQYPTHNCLPISTQRQTEYITAVLAGNNPVQISGGITPPPNPVVPDPDPVGPNNPSDRDEDGVVDAVDNCPANANANQLNTDGDSQGDACDADDDNDGVADAYDLYPSNNSQAGDYDDDGVDSFVDVDYDGDGLIEIITAAELNMTRNNLQGTGFSSDAGQQGSSTGCGGGTDINNNSITSCSGYELVADIDLAASGYTNWEPIGSCGTAETCLTNTHLFFNATFEGNDNAIHNLSITSNADLPGVGLFGIAGVGADFNNINLTNVNIDTPDSALVGGIVGGLLFGGIISHSFVEINQMTALASGGGLIGFVLEGNVLSSSAKVNQMNVNGTAGGLVGGLYDHGTITSSSAVVNSIVGSSFIGIGGLVGIANNASITDSSADANYISGDSGDVGGLVGWAYESTIDTSTAVVNHINGSYNTGGLIGDVFNSTISSSSAEVNQISGDIGVGGLIGDIDRSTIDKSTVVVNNITGNSEVGGIIGSGYATIISSSSAIVNLIDGGKPLFEDQTGGLAGWGYDMSIIYSSAIINRLSGNSQVGGLVGVSAGEKFKIDNSYVVVNTVDGYGDGLVGYYNPDVYAIEKDGYVEYNFTNSPNSVDTSTIARASYWNDDASFSSGSIGEAKSRSELTNTTSFTGVYAAWGESYCNPSTGATSTTQRSGFVPVWNLGNATQYPNHNCLPISTQRQTEYMTAVLAGNNPVQISGGGSGGGIAPDPDPVAPPPDPVVPNNPSDRDGDGVLDAVDNCPATANAEQIDADGDGQGDTCDADDDNDGVADAYDLYPTNNSQAGDYDGDGYDSFVDVDYDGDGLIEIITAAELDMLRNNLQGTGLSDASGRQGNSTGCGGGTDINNNSITSCSGYELMADIDLAASGYTNWEPIGSCGELETCLTDTHLFFNTTFEGNNNAIYNLTINSNPVLPGIGLFAIAGAGAEFNNIILTNVNIDTSDNAVGGLVGGLFNGGVIRNSHVEANQINGLYSVGGLAGALLFGSSIESSSAVVDEINFNGAGGGLAGAISFSSSINSSSAIVDNLASYEYESGGLVGSVLNSVVTHSSAEVNQMTGDYQIGGLIGWVSGSTIESSTAAVNNINGNSSIGGFVGWGNNATISSSSTIVNHVNGNDSDIGGLVGFANNMKLTSSSATLNQINGRNYVGGLVGRGAGESFIINSSYAVTNSIYSPNNFVDINGLVGLYDSYANVSVVVDGGSILELINRTSESNMVNIPTIAQASYWNVDVSFPNGQSDTNDLIGEAKSRSELTNTTSFTGIYATWGELYCDPDTGATSITQRSGFVPIWNLANVNEYPTHNCLPISTQSQTEYMTAVLAGNNPVQISGGGSGGGIAPDPDPVAPPPDPVVPDVPPPAPDGDGTGALNNTGLILFPGAGNLNITNVFNVDNATYGDDYRLAGARGLGIATIENNKYLIVASQLDSSLSAFLINDDGSLVLSDTINYADNRSSRLFEVSGVEVVTIGSDTYVYTSSFGIDSGDESGGINGFKLESDGSLSYTFSYSADDLGAFNNSAAWITSGVIEDNHYIFVNDGRGANNEGSNALGVFQVISSGIDKGRLAHRFTLTGTSDLPLNNTATMETARIAGKSYLFVSQGLYSRDVDMGSGIIVFEIASTGVLIYTTNVMDGDGIPLNGTLGLTTTTIGIDNSPHLISSALYDNALNSFRIATDSNGNISLDYADTWQGISDFSLDGPLSIVTKEIGGNLYAFVASGFGVATIDTFLLSNDGSLELVARIEDTIDTNLDGPYDVTIAEVGGYLYLFVAGWEDNGISVFRIGFNQ